ncbi:MAG: glycosyltransferase family 2 protein [Janthinobacterium lividum]
MLVSIVLPVYNESSSIEELLLSISNVFKSLEHSYSFEIVFVDDGSTDDTLKVLKENTKNLNNSKIIELRKNYGQTAALQAGLSAASGEIIISMDADLQHFPGDIPAFLDKIKEGNDVVCGWRKERKEGIIRRWPSKVANFLLRKISGLEIRDIGTTFRAYHADIIKDISLLGENHRFIPIYARAVGAKIDQVVIENIERPYGKSNYGISRTLNVFLDLFFLCYFTHYIDRPIRIFGKIAFILCSIAFVISAWLIVMALFYNTPVVRDHSGWFSLAILLFTCSLQLILTGIIAEVIARIYYSTSEKTKYKIRKVWNKENIS